MWWLAMLASAQAPTPVYLECEVGAGGRVEHFDFAIDEAGQQVTIGRKDGSVAVVSALYSPAQIVAREPIGSAARLWTFNRVDLTIKSGVSFSPDTVDGTCRIKPAPAKRAF